MQVCKGGKEASEDTWTSLSVVCGNLGGETQNRFNQKSFTGFHIIAATFGQYRHDSSSAFLAWPH